ncbi:Hint domain-containing protein [Tabrizicola sp.]|uniref:Hint domain-containing protein n=1 Tax=Tabrizicola sp. TaxID=2005166 RepID=UPI00260A7403|nr:Hint domain-containing protein [Tabrizicola sp.]MDM7932492.1 Hint domain-containing protein [Tabrizicola sp.]
MPPPTNIIFNGTFDLRGAGWSGTDLETSHTESAYFGNGSTNRVAEMDGQRGQTTIMQQVVAIGAPIQTELTFVAGLRNGLSRNAGEGFRVDILDSDGVVIATSTILPTTVGSYTSYSIPVNFTTAGDYTVRFTELGRNDSTGAIVDNISMLVCFAGQTVIDTPTGGKPAIDVQIGDLVTTESGTAQVRWVGRRRVTAADMAANDKLRPVRICAGALGRGLPRADLRVSRQHRMLVSSPICQRMFGHSDILVSALKLTALPGIYIDDQVSQIDYVHLLFDQHEVVFAEGAPSESLLLHAEALSALSPEALEEIRLIFPEIDAGPDRFPRAKLIPKGSQQTRVAERMLRNDRSPLEALSCPKLC